VLHSEVDRSGGAFTRIPNSVRRQVSRPRCAICGRQYNRVFALTDNCGRQKIRYPRQILDHLIPRRFLNQHGIFEHHVLNMLSVCQYDHAPKAKLEDRLYQGDVLSYLQGLKKLNYPVEKVVKFALSVGLKEFAGVKV
jgi:hypothetical protein